MTAPTSDERHRVAERLREQPQWTIDTEFLEMLGYLCDTLSWEQVCR